MTLTAPLRSGPSVRVLLTGGAALALTGWLCALGGWGGVAWWAAPSLATAVAGGELAAVRLASSRQRWNLSFTEVALAAALALATGAWVVVAVGAGAALAQAVRAAPGPARVGRVVQLVLAAAVGQQLAASAGGGAAAACVGMLAFWTARNLLDALPLLPGRPPATAGTADVARAALHTAGGASFGLLAAHLAVTAPAALLALVVPLALLRSSADQQGRAASEVRLFAELARGQEREGGRSRDVSAQVVVTAAARLLGDADVDLVLLAADGPVVYRGDARGAPQRRRVGPDVFDEPWVRSALGSRGLAYGRDEQGPHLVAVLGDPDDPAAVLRARRGVRSPSFDPAERRLAALLVAQAEAWLSGAPSTPRTREAPGRADVARQTTKALSHLDSATAPALLVLRESADRLARLAERAGGVDDIVEELHLVERAVASLLGAIALAAHPDLEPREPSWRTPEPRTRAGADWTTTGVLR